MKIAVIDPSFYTPPYDAALCAALGRLGHEVALFAREPRPTDPPLGASIDVRPLFYRASERLRGRVSRPAFLLAKSAEHLIDLPRLQWALHRYRPDVVHWQWPSLPAVDAVFLERFSRYVPQIVTVHDSNLFHHEGLQRARAWGWHAFLRRASRLVAHVNATRNALLAIGLPCERIDLIPHGIFPARPGEVRTDGARAAPAHGGAAPDAPLRVLFVGRVSADKGVDVFLEAIDAFPHALRQRVRFQVYGPPAADDATLAHAHELARLGRVDLRLEFIPEGELEAAIRAAAIVVLPHRDVDASGVLMKSMAYDTCLVASDIASFREVLGARRAAALFRAGDALALRDELVSLVEEPTRRRVLTDALILLRGNAYSWPEVARRTVAAYERALAGPVLVEQA